MDCKQIIKKYLKENGYDGLVDCENECGCELGNLMPCDGVIMDCEPGYKGPDLSGDCDFLIYRTKNAAQKAQAAKDAIDVDDAVEKEQLNNG